MTKGLNQNEPNGREVYADIIDLPHHQSATRPHMSMYSRAGQFSAFDALTGYSDIVKETAKNVEAEVERSGKMTEDPAVGWFGAVDDDFFI